MKFLWWTFGPDAVAARIEALCEKRRLTSRIVSRAEFVEGDRRVEVALALTRSTFYYENRDLRAALELQWVAGVEYDARLSDGTAIPAAKVLRLHCYEQVLEFILADDLVARWHMMLPPRAATRNAASGKSALPIPAGRAA